MRLYFKNTPTVDFWTGVKSGLKTHTCRRRGAKVGTALELICGKETENAVCLDTRPLKIELAPYGPVISVDGALLEPEAVETFWRHGGFPSREAMFDYYGDDFQGFVIKFREGGF